MEFYQLKVKQVKKETPEAVSLFFEVPENLKEKFGYLPGQYVTIKAKIGGEEIRRSYSINTSPYTDQDISVTAKKIANGKMSTYLNEQVQAGDLLEVSSPLGNFTPELDPHRSVTYLCIAAGSGITPIMSIIKSALYVEKQSKILLIYGNRNKENTIFYNELSALQKENPGRFKIHFVFSREKGQSPNHEGRIDPAKVDYFLETEGIDLSQTEAFICGPFEMTENIKQHLSKKLDKKQIHTELFYSKPLPSGAHPEVVPNGESEVVVILDDMETTIKMPKKGISILDAAMEAGLDVPFSCKGAVCCTCKAKVLEGNVVMEQNYALTDDEVDQGFVLTCQSHPVSDRVKISYDDLF
ncbi:MAG: phenylacetic acid degradation protein [Vicingaceae bacterium]|nr:MAG: phenylacetic acid degradation protein [Vicingaceae bacterium]